MRKRGDEIRKEMWYKDNRDCSGCGFAAAFFLAVLPLRKKQSSKLSWIEWGMKPPFWVGNGFKKRVNRRIEYARNFAINAPHGTSIPSIYLYYRIR